MALKNKNERQMASQISNRTKVPELRSTPSQAYSDFALSGIKNGTYKTAHEGEIASFKRNEARKYAPQPVQNSGKQNAPLFDDDEYNYLQKTYNVANSGSFLTPNGFGFGMGINPADLPTNEEKSKYTTEYFENKFGKSMQDVFKDFEEEKAHREQQAGKGHGLLNMIGRIATAPAEGAVGALDAINNTIRGNSEANQLLQKQDYNARKSLKNVQEGVTSEMSPVGRGLYNAVQTGAQRAVNKGVSKLIPIPYLDRILNAGLTAGEKTDSLTERGITGRSAGVQADISGAADFALQGLMNNKWYSIPVKEDASKLTKALVSVLGSGVVGGAELGSVSAIDQIVDTALNNDKSNYAIRKSQYMENGDDENTAMLKAFGDAAKEVGLSALAGFIASALTSPARVRQKLPDDYIGVDRQITAGGNAPTGGSNSILPAITSDLQEPVAIQGQNFPALPEMQLPAAQPIQLPGTNGVIELPELASKAASISENVPSLMQPLRGEALTAVKAQIKDNNATIKALQDEIEIIKNNPKNLYRGNLKKAVQAQIRDKEKQIRQLRADNTAAQRKASGKPAPIREQLSKDDRANLFNYKAGGLDTHVNYTTQYAGNTPEAKALSKEVKNAVRKFVESGDINDYALLMDKATELDNLAKTVNATRSTGNYLKTYSEYYGDSSLVDSIANNEALWHAYALANTNNKVAANSTGLNNTPRLTEEVGKSAPEKASVGTYYPDGRVFIDPVDMALADPNVATTHSPEELAVMREYADSTDSNLLEYIKNSKNETKIKPYRLKDISERMSSDMKAATGLGNAKELTLDQSIIRDHIYPRHGADGAANQTMADDNTLARIQYVLDNYDEAYKGEGSSYLRMKDKSIAPTTAFTKKVDNHYVVVVVESDNSKVAKVVSVYVANENGLNDDIQKGKLIRLSHDADSTLPRTPEANSLSLSSETNVPQNNQNVNPTTQNEVPNVNNNTDAQAYYLRILGDPNFLQEQATAHNLDPNQLVSAANAYLGYSTEVPSFGNPTGTVPPTTPPGDEPPTSGGGPKMKTSETYTNTGKRGGGWTEEEYDQYTDPSQFQYESVDEQESVERAIQMRQKEGREGFKNRMMNAKEASGSEIDGLMMEWRDLGKEARELEAAGKDASAVRQESIRVFRKIQQLTTNHAQAMQALAKWSRNTPEGMLSRAEHIANGKINKDEVDKGKLRQQLDKLTKNRKNFQFEDEFVQEFLDKAEEVLALDPTSRESKIALAELGKMVNAQIPSTFGEKLITVLMDNMLGNFRTLISRNAGGNVGLNAFEQFLQRPLAAGIDSLVSQKTGARMQAGLTKEGLKEYFGGFAQGLKEEWDDFKKGLHTARSGENTLENAIASNRHVFNNKIMDRMDGLIRHGLSVGDRPFYEGVYNQTIGDYYRLREKGSMGDVIQGLSDDDFKTYAETAARLNALAAVYQKDTALTNALLGIKQSVGELSRGIFGVDILSQFSMPFVKTPGGVVDVAVSYSPLGIVRNAAQTYREVKNDSFDQSRFVNDASRNILGTAGMLGAAGATTAAVLNKGYSEDNDEKKAEKESGKQEYSLNLGNGRQMDIGWIPVLGSNAVAAAATVDAYEKEMAKGNKSPVKALAKGLQEGGESLLEQAVFQGMQKLFGGNSYDTEQGLVGNMVETVKSGMGQGIPALVRQVAQTTDPYQRDLANSNPNLSFGPWDNYDINSYLNNLPILRELTLAPKVGNNGELVKENQGRNFASRVLENMILPGKVTKVETNRLDEEAARLKKATTSAEAFMPRTSRDKVDTAEHTLTNDEWVDYQQKYYGEMTDIGTQIMDSDLYQKSNDAVKVKMLKEAYDAIKDGVNSEYNGKDVDGAAKRYRDAGGGEEGIKAALQYIMSGNNEYGLERKAYDKAVEEGEDLTKYKGYKEALEESGLTDNKERRNEYEQGGADALNQEASDKQMFKEQFNLDAPSVAPTWQKAKSVFPQLQPNEFDKQFREIAGLLDGDDLAIKQDEITKYINNHAAEYKDKNGEWDMDKVNKTWRAYGSDGWAFEPTIKKDGTIGKKKKK